MPTARLLSVSELIARYCGRISSRTLKRWRKVGCGPEWSRLGGRIFYTLRDVEEWEHQRRRLPLPAAPGPTIDARPIESPAVAPDRQRKRS
jgi:hypothetical protein